MDNGKKNNSHGADYSDLYQDAEGKGSYIDTNTLPDGEGMYQRNMASIRSAPGGGSQGGNYPGAASTDGMYKQNMASVKSAPTMEALIGPLFDGEDLTEEFKEKATTVFEATINSRVSDIQQQLTEEYEVALAEHIEEVTQDLTEKLDQYLNYVVKEWMDENKLAVEQGIRTNVSENFMHGLKSLFENCWIDVPDSKVDLVSELEQQNNELKEQVNSLLEANVQLNSSVNEEKKEGVLHTISEGLTSVQKSKFKQLADNISYDSIDSYARKLETLKENYFGNSYAPVVKNEGDMSEESSNPSLLTESDNDVMNIYVNSLSHQLKNNKKKSN